MFGKYIQWALLTLITCGIYTFWRKLKMRKWILSHTHFVGVQEHSDFDGGLLELTFIGWIANIVSLITLGIASFWMNCWKERYYAKHSIIDGHRLYFTGTGGQYFAKKIVWLLLTVITCGIYSFWLAQRVKKWEVKHTQVECPESIPFDQMAWDAYQAEMGLRTSPEWKNATLLFIIGLISIPNMPILPIVLFFLSANNAKKVKRSGLYGIATFLAFILIFLYIVVALFVVVMLSGIELPFGWKFG